MKECDSQPEVGARSLYLKPGLRDDAHRILQLPHSTLDTLSSCHPPFLLFDVEFCFFPAVSIAIRSSLILCDLASEFFRL